MKTYRRILVCITAADQEADLLQRTAELSRDHPAHILALRVIDTRSGFEADGPAATLPGDAAARRAPAAKRRLDLLLARCGLAWAESRVLCGEPADVLAQVGREWAPDLILTAGRLLPEEVGAGTDVLRVGCRNWLARLAGMLASPQPRHA